MPWSELVSSEAAKEYYFERSRENEIQIEERTSIGQKKESWWLVCRRGRDESNGEEAAGSTSR